jgi:hypothetical protein
MNGGRRSAIRSFAGYEARARLRTYIRGAASLCNPVRICRGMGPAYRPAVRRDGGTGGRTVGARTAKVGGVHVQNGGQRGSTLQLI